MPLAHGRRITHSHQPSVHFIHKHINRPRGDLEQKMNSAPYQNTRSKSPRKNDAVHPSSRNDTAQQSDEYPDVSAMYTTFPLPPDNLVTKTSISQDETTALCMRFMTGQESEISQRNSHGIPGLQRSQHISFLKKSLEKYPSRFQGMDASRPWILYWTISALNILGVDVSVYRERVIDTFAPLQHSEGGFGGGYGQTAHGAATYAAILCLAQVRGLELVDRTRLWKWLCRLKCSDGGFSMAVHGERDVRGAYCAMIAVSLLNLPLSLTHDCEAAKQKGATLITGLGAWIGRCQSYEGGIGGNPGTEAHGAYTFLGIACLCLLDAPRISIPKYLDIQRLVAWVSSRAVAPEGGYAGRTNKLVDACYSHWIAGCWPLLEAALSGPSGNNLNLWDREALVRYTLCCSQSNLGGLRDKPNTKQDAYHTWYSLAGMQAAQNTWTYDCDQAGDDALNLRKLSISKEKSEPLRAGYGWKGRVATPTERRQRAFDADDQVGLVHPLFMIALEAVEATRMQFAHGTSVR